jgi:Putative beta barrel porin-7 (BBP7)
VSNTRNQASVGRWATVLLLLLAGVTPARAQTPQPAGPPSLSLYGRPVAQPFFDFPTSARYSGCRPVPLAWGYDPCPDYGACDCDGPGDCNSDVACPGDFVAHRPSDWYATADFAPLLIDHLDGYIVARQGPITGRPNRLGAAVLTTEDLEPEFAAGGKFTVGRHIFDCYRLEGTYLGKHDWDDLKIVMNTEATPAGFGSLSTFLSGFRLPITPGLDGNNRVYVFQRSTLQSAELNLRYWANMPPGPFDVSYLVGARYLQINEQFNFVGRTSDNTSPTPTNDLLFDTRNDLMGVQIGIAGSWLVTPRCWIDVDLKGGIYNNSASQESSLRLLGVVRPTIRDSRDATAFVGDLSLISNWQMSPNWTFRLGYQALFVNGVALAHEQRVSPVFQNSPGALNDSGELCYHGPVIGLTWMR